MVHETNIPFDQMWPNVTFWMPMSLKHITFRGKAVVENVQLKECIIENIVRTEQ